MNKRYRLCDVEEAVSEMEEFMDIADDIAEIDDDMQIVISGWAVYIESLNLTLRQGTACVWDESSGLFMPDFDVTVVYEGNIETGYSRSGASVVNESGESMQASFPADSLYYEQDGFVVTLGNWLNGRMSGGQIEQLWCELVTLETNNTDKESEE